MRLFHLLFVVLLFLLAIIVLAGVLPTVPGATGAPHPEFPGMFISPADIDQEDHTRWLGYLFGLGIIALFGIMLLVGNRKKGKFTSIRPWLIIGLIIYTLVYTGMTVSHWSYSLNEGGPFILSMPAPTTWMIVGVWFVPFIITIAYILKFEDAVISDQEIEEFERFIEEREVKNS